jgi:hypothetical protein
MCTLNFDEDEQLSEPNLNLKGRSGHWLRSGIMEPRSGHLPLLNHRVRGWGEDHYIVKDFNYSAGN